MTINAINSKSEIHEKLRLRTIVLHTTVGRFACLELDVLALLFYAGLKHLLQMRCRFSLTLADVSEIMPYFSRYGCFKAVNISKSTCTCNHASVFIAMKTAGVKIDGTSCMAARTRR